MNELFPCYENRSKLTREANKKNTLITDIVSGKV
jgi:hypothetical protein